MHLLVHKNLSVLLAHRHHPLRTTLGVVLTLEENIVRCLMDFDRLPTECLLLLISSVNECIVRLVGSLPYDRSTLLVKVKEMVQDERR
ncbi:MAG: hypothetical protein QXT45_04190 [Candidatus Bilamarchaeaceae archaeon]